MPLVLFSSKGDGSRSVGDVELVKAVTRSTIFNFPPPPPSLATVAYQSICSHISSPVWGVGWSKTTKPETPSPPHQTLIDSLIPLIGRSPVLQEFPVPHSNSHDLVQPSINTPTFFIDTTGASTISPNSYPFSPNQCVFDDPKFLTPPWTSCEDHTSISFRITSKPHTLDINASFHLPTQLAPITSFADQHLPPAPPILDSWRPSIQL